MCKGREREGNGRTIGISRFKKYVRDSASPGGSSRVDCVESLGPGWCWCRDGDDWRGCFAVEYGQHGRCLCRCYR